MPASPRPGPRARWPKVVLAALLATAAACSGDDADPATTAPPITTVAPPTIATASTAATTLPATGPALRLTAMGDSYSAGLGAPTPLQKFTDCWRDPQASVGTLVADRLRARGRSVALDLRACDGGTISAVLSGQLPGAAPADALVVTFGGNDLGFRRILTECLGTSGCRSYDQPGDRLPGFAHEVGRSDWEVLEDRLVDGYLRLREALAPGGTIYVLTYPVPFPAAPDEACMAQRAGIAPASRVLANAAVDRLDETIVAAARRANERAATTVIRVVEWRTGLDTPRREVTDAAGITRAVRDNPDGICSPDPVLNGLVSSELSDSFHPTERGHRLAADAVVEAILRTR